MQKLIEQFEKLEEFVAKNELSSALKDLQNLQEKEAIASSEDLKAWLEEHKKEGKELKLGIVGRVKAGKSSLLNALFFEGKDILPKAATPMTAALTILEYDESLSASVEFFSNEDLKKIEAEHARYEKELKQRVDERLEEEKARAEKKARQEQKELNFDLAKEREKARKTIEKELKSTVLYASYEQYEKIEKSGIKPHELETNLKASSIEELKDILQDYVGAEGKYMPFTKSVTLRLNLEGLKDMKIIDSPGINDPIVSREERTKKLLKDCDAVFLISPAGQFLNAEDLNLLDRISDKEGICEFRILASQADNQLFTDAREKGGGTLNGALESIKTSLSSNFEKTLSAFKEERNSAEIKKTIDKLIKSGTDNLLLSSSACYAMFKNFDNKASWDSNLQRVWENLNDEYKDFFSDESTAKENLKSIANIELIQDNLAQIRSNKDIIIENKQKSYVEAKKNTFKSYSEGIAKLLQARIDELNSKDKASIAKQISELSKQKANASFELGEAYEQSCFDFKYGLDDKLKEQKAHYFKEAKKETKDSQKIESETYEVSNSSWYNPFSWGSTKTKTREFQTINAADVRNALDEMLEKLQDLFNIEINKQKEKFRRKLYEKLIGVIQKNFNAEEIDLPKIAGILKSIIASIPVKELDYSDKLPDKLKQSGKLIKWEAEEFMEEVNSFLSEFSKEVSLDINNFIKDLEKSLESSNIVEKLFASYEEELQRLQSELENKELNIEKYSKMLAELKELNNV
ncbi:hypothetical protein CQA38_08225 [Campylobacter sp. MIT 12-5580]|uniref:dynamin family protein n=1 Tax=Campylobacter sp. MIT 12-5580 TaxID=2040651 RepID=UPI0010F45901|nr:dynamin family protein [Campylobacter sp. MIT 12-5580]TKX28346.1 hypothetical protein CQA38_08225 [Campylobacter sp. MIT 12-5580]